MLKDKLPLLPEGYIWEISDDPDYLFVKVKILKETLHTTTKAKVSTRYPNPKYKPKWYNFHSEYIVESTTQDVTKTTWTNVSSRYIHFSSEDKYNSLVESDIVDLASKMKDSLLLSLSRENYSGTYGS